MLINNLLGSGKSFALYFRPGKAEIEFVAGDATVTNDFKGSKGFAFAPYLESEIAPSLLIAPDVYARGIDAVTSAIEQFEVTTLCQIQNSSITSKDQSDFEHLVQDAIDEINTSTVLEKVVLSRAMTQQLPEGFDPSAFLFKMRKHMPKAFCYLVYTPESGMWMGATPERLFEHDGITGKTNSIAGTMPFDSIRDWTDKEKNEQEIVSCYILDQLKDSGIADIKIVGPTAVKSGSVQHLKTEFSFPLSDAGAVSELINALHPTPAICGMPKIEAQKFIEDNEVYNREYYSGYLGPLGLDDSHSIFVNLRCMKLMQDVAVLYVGAGISDGSVAQDEWEETQTKALTLLNLLQSN